MFIVLLSILFPFFSCENPLKQTLDLIVRDYSRPLITVSPGNGEGIDKNTSIVITFSETMETGTLTLGGTMPAESNGGVWSTYNGEANSRLTISPSTSWGTGSGHILTVECYDTDGYETENMILTYGVLDGIVYVRAADGDDSFPGTKTEPKKTLPAAIELADKYYSQAEVRVAGGVYNVDYSLGTHVVMREGISLYGGYTEDDWDVRDYAVYESKIKDNGDVTSPDPVPDEDRNRAVDCGTGLTAATVLEGFTVEGGGGSVSIGINCAASNPTIRGNTILGGAGDLSAGLRIKDCSPLISGNDIDGGTGADYALGIFTANSSALIENNTIYGGVADSCDGIFNQESSPTIRNNIITGGYSNGLGSNGITNWTAEPLIIGNTIDGGYGYSSVSGIYNTKTSDPVIRNNVIYGGDGTAGDTTTSFGILLEDSTGTIQNNTINGGDPGSTFDSMAHGIELTRSTPVIENNILFTSGGVNRYGIYEFGSGARPSSFNNNDVFDCPTALYAYWNGSGHDYYSNFTTINSLSWASANIADTPVFVDLNGADTMVQTLEDNDWHLSSSTPLSISQGALDLSSDFNEDKDGTQRSAPWSMGAYEKD